MSEGIKVCPPLVKAAIGRYVTEGIQPSGFVKACLENNLVGAISRADGKNRDALLEIVTYMMWEIPAPIWGSKEKVQEHLATWTDCPVTPWRSLNSSSVPKDKCKEGDK